MTTHIIGIAGASCSGKTTLAARIAEHATAGTATLISLDSYYRDLSHLTPDARAEWNFDAPNALDDELLLKHLKILLSGTPVYIPVYDFSTHTRIALTERANPATFVIMEGLFVLYWPQIRDIVETKVFISVPDEVCLERRIARDTRERGRTEESVRQQYATTVRPMYEKYCRPTAKFADLQLSGQDDADELASAVLKKVEASEK